MSFKNSTVAKTATIEDSLLEPYYLIVDEHQFALHKRIPSGHQTQAKTYHSSLAGALRHIVFLQALRKSKGHSQTLREFIDQYECVGEKILSAFDHVKVL